MAFKPTEMQEKAIYTRGNVLVSAAAGSGKTAVLVERVAQLLTDKKSPVSADRLLIVTFTNAAAAEMRSRIEKRVYAEILEHPDDERLQEQKYLLQNADICTIDSFCIKLVRENFEKCGIEPDFKVGNGIENIGIQKKVMADILSEQLENPSVEFHRLLELANCEYDEKGLTDLIEKIYNYSQQLPFPQNFINGLLSPYEREFSIGHVWYDLAFIEAEKKLDSIQYSLEKMSDAANCVMTNYDKHIECIDKMTKIIDRVTEQAASKDWNLFASELSTIKFPSAQSTAKDDEGGIAFKNHKKSISDIIKALKEIFYADTATIAEEISADKNAVKLLVDMISKYTARLFEEYKKENSFTFSNMEQMALELLCEYKDGKIVVREDASELCQRYDEVLVDEFQDVNDLQDTLFNVLSNNEEKLFVVGDIKQSIYGFRGSNPENFLNKKNRYVPFEEADKDDSKKIILSDNFRSRKGVCEAINFFFTELMAGQVGSIIYNKDERLNAGGTFPESNAPTAEILAVDKCEDESEDSLLETEAKRIAEYIISVMNEGAVISDGDNLRAARYSDFAILLNAFQNKAPIIGGALKEQGIPVTVGDESFMQSIEVASVMSLLQVIDNPKSDVELLQVMMSPLFAFTADEMAAIRINKRKCPLYSAVVISAEKGNKKCADFIEKLAAFRRDAAVLPVDRLISKLIYSADILNWVVAMPSGKTKKDNLFALIEYAKSYTTRFDSGIYGFIKYMKSLPESSFKNESSSGENAVKIMTMHHSKGLQFPVCIVANLSSKINQSDSISREIFSEKCGISFKYYDEQAAQDVQMLGHKLMSRTARVKTVEEKLRLLYVAATRAIDRVCFVCSSNDLDAKLTSLSNSLSEKAPHVTRDFLEKGLNMSDWILSCALMHPNGDVLRNYCDVSAPTVASEAAIKITISQSDDEIALDEQTTTEEVTISEDFANKIKQNAEYRYPYEPLRHLQAKASVSRLVHSAEDDRYAFVDQPAFMLGDKLTGAARGTAMHHIMQFIKLEQNVDVDAEIERLLEWKFVTDREVASADIDAIKKFFASELYNRIISSNEVRREMRFLSEIPATRIDDTVDIDGANILVQGAIDLCFIEDDGIVVLDFKTDRVDNMTTLVDRYGEQLAIYSTAAEKIFGLAVKEKIIYSFHLGESISF